ncbi:glycosyltransferase family 4 protein [Devosia algicola]|uniref:Glycosyltransferase family 4 protein n=1 Tax=Devosia algicola TaxID=3026418 RepID=A0ABY7YJK6_9HYPH|nr:glycosyltransferase family 4 protein [Devosia algicola]WDR01362.1 glycosyltransferase family 4 protein [Devosia algicola]
MSIMARNARFNIANGGVLAGKAKDQFGVKNVLPLYHGIDTQYWSNGADKQHGMIVCARRFEPIYDNDTIIRAFGQCHDSGQGLSLTFTADGTLLEGARKLAAEVAPHGAKSIEFIGGGVDADHLRRLFASSEIYVSMSLSDGASTALLQAMAMGCFPVVSDIPANREWLDHGCDIELVSVGAVDALAEALQRVHGGMTRRANAIERNRAIVEKLASSRTNLSYLARYLRGHAE